MGYYRYNGVTLDALPEWDEAAYPNAYIMESSLGSGTYALHVSASKLHLNASDYGEMMWEIDASPRLIYSFDTSTWNESISTSQGAYEIDRLLWTNYDILGDDGETVLFAASDPVPVEEDEPKRISLDPTAMLMGWLVGKRVAGLRKTQTDVPVVPDEPDVPDTPDEPSGEPIAYLYNGVRLPDINEVWTDKETCPKAYIVSMDGITALFVSANPIVVDVEGTVYIYSDYGTACGVSLLGDGAWAEMDLSTGGTSEAPLSTVIWTSHDILNPDGTTYLAASEPVPVYE